MATDTQPETQPESRRSRPRRRRDRGATWVIIGILILLFPVGATLYNDHRLHQISREYEESVRAIEPSERVRQYLDEAHEYNRTLAREGHHAMPPRAGTPGWDAYVGTLDAPETNGVLARVEIPTIGVDLPVYHGTSAEVLYQGAGHMFGSDLPVGGDGTTSVISAHNGMVDATMFDNLFRVRNGDDVYIDVMGETLRYRVTGRQVVGPHDDEAITYEPGRDKLVLVTCTPYGLNTDRLLVEAERAPLDSVGRSDDGWVPSLSWWMILDLLLIVLILLVLLRRWWKRRMEERRRRRDDLASEGTVA